MVSNFQHRENDSKYKAQIDYSFLIGNSPIYE